MAKVLGLDLGTNSIGWALADGNFRTAGATIYPNGNAVSNARTLIKNICRYYNFLPDNIRINHQLPQSLQDRSLQQQRKSKRIFRRYIQRFAASVLYYLRHNLDERFYQSSFTSGLKTILPLLIHCLLAVLFTAFLLMAAFHPKDFQFWFNLAITVLLAWIALKK